MKFARFWLFLLLSKMMTPHNYFYFSGLLDYSKVSKYVLIFIAKTSFGFSLGFHYFCRMIENFQPSNNTDIDTEFYKGLRVKMVKELKNCNTQICNILNGSNICSNNALEAIQSVPRHIFVAQGIRHLAYQDRPLPIAGKQTISQPSTVALQSSLLGEIKNRKVLEIGTGCGYQTAVLAKMGAKVYTIERQKDLCRIANGNLKKLGITGITLCWGDGYKGLSQAAPFHAILITCGAESVPESLLLQLEIGGRMVIPVGENNKEQQMFVITRTGEKQFDRIPVGKCSFVPMLEGVVDTAPNSRGK